MTTTPTTPIRALLDDATARLAAAGVPSPAVDAELLLAYVLGVPRLRARLASAVSPAQQGDFADLVRRRATRVPLQHLTGSAAFRGIELAVGPGVFVPRPETEVVAGAAIDCAKSLAGKGSEPRAPVVVDLCTGSGAIALAVAAELAELPGGARVHACERELEAYDWAARNIAAAATERPHALAVNLALSDAATAFPELDGTVDVVVSNPPYIPVEAYESVPVEVRDHDPAAALWAGPDGLSAIRMIERTAARLTRPGGYAIVEHADVQGVSAVQVFARTGAWAEASDHPDLAGRSRYVVAKAGFSNVS